jgi:aspartate/methionine/tyrosine aminotransferase
MLDLAAEVENPVLLMSGDPNFRTPDHIIKASADAALAGSTGYAPGGGFPAMREAIAAKDTAVNGLEVAADEVCVTTGACGGLFSSLLLIVEPGDDVLLPDPGWSNYAAQVHVLGATPRPYPVGASTGWQLDPAAVEAVITPRTSAIVLNSPSNPTGVVFDPKALEEVVAIADRRGIAVVSDEAYDQLIFAGEPFSVASRADSDQIVTVYAFSKTYAMTGWRLGYVVGERDFIRELSLHQEPLVSSASTISQHAAMAALEGPQECVTEMVDAYRRRAAYVVSALEAMGTPAVEPGGSFFVMADIRGTGLDSWDFSVRLLREYGVGVVPGAAFGAEGEGFVRITLAASQETLSDGLTKMATAVDVLRSGTPGRSGKEASA